GRYLCVRDPPLLSLSGSAGRRDLHSFPTRALPISADVAGHGNTGCFNLCILNPPRFQSLKAELAEGNLVTPGGHTGHAAPVDSAILNSLGNKHPYSPPLSFFWAAVSGRTSPW